MPSIDSRAPLTLSFRRAEVAAFWIVGTAACALSAGVVAARAGSSEPWLWAAAGTAVAAPGLIWPRWFRFGVRVWNKGARLAAAALRRYVLRVTYYTVFAGTSVAGSALGLSLDPSERSRWVSRAVSSASTSETPTAGGLLMASRRPGARWMLSLLPIVAMLRMLGDEQVDSAPASTTYTLY